MPAKEVYGAQPPIELLRQIIDQKGCYNTKENILQEFVDIQMIGAMGPSYAGRNSVTPRFTRHFNVFGIIECDDNTLENIYGTVLNWHFSTNGFNNDILNMSNTLIRATRTLYKISMANLLPTPAKSHYTFNVRDFSRVIQGILLATPTVISTSKLIRLWFHEVYRVFYDRLIDDIDRNWLYTNIRSILEDNFKVKFDELFQTYDSNKDGIVDENDMRSLIFGKFGVSSEPKYYDEVTNMEELTVYLEKSLGDYNLNNKKTMDLVMFRFAIEHLSRISRVLQQPRGNILLVGLGGSGRQSLTRLAAYLGEFHVIQLEIAKNYIHPEHIIENLKR